MRTILKKWYKFQQDHRSKKFDSHWYIRFGWQKNPLEENQLNNLFEIHYNSHNVALNKFQPFLIAIQLDKSTDRDMVLAVHVGAGLDKEQQELEMVGILLFRSGTLLRLRRRFHWRRSGTYLRSRHNKLLSPIAYT